MEERPKYSVRKPRVKPDGLTEESRKKMSESSKFLRSKETKKLMSIAKRRQFVKRNPLKEGEVYVSYIHPNGSRRHIIAVLSKGMELSLSGLEWAKLSVTEKAIKEAQQRLK